MKRKILSGIGIFVLILAGLAGCGIAVRDAASGETPAGDPLVCTGNNQFAFDLYRRLATDPAYAGDNLFFSPYSVSSALAIACEGARGTTADEIGAVLHLPANDTLRREGFATLNRKSGTCTLRTANALWAEETYSLLPDYINVVARWYGANVTNLDFIENPEGSRETINRWVEEETEDRIRDLLPPGSIDPLTRLVITNAIYFKGTWAKQFDADTTQEEGFRAGPNEMVTVPMMHGDAVYPYAETETLQVLEMPYAHESGLAMLVLLPKEDSLAAAEEALDAERFIGLRESLVAQNVRVSFPKFTFDAGYSLPPTLAAMGMPTAFTGDADLSGMDGTKDLLITGVFHKAFVDVDEEGTEAAAATGVIGGRGVTPAFRANHPFVFLIIKKDSGAILFIGRVVNPEGA